jgi:putative phosphoribosyl transferase
MYFRNRAEAGKLLAAKLAKYKEDNTVVLALSPGGVIVGAQIAMRLHSNLMFLMTENINLPGEPEAMAAISSVGSFTYNTAMYSPGQIEEFVGDYHQFIEEQRLTKLHKLNRMVGEEGEVRKEYLRRHTVILTTDGLTSGFSLDIAGQYLNTIAIKKLVMATPIASVPAVDRMHLVCDEIFCLDVLQNYMFTDHYYDDNSIPNVDGLMKIMRNISVNWDRNYTAGTAQAG